MTNQTNMSLVMRKRALYICKNKDADQLRSKCTADQRLCFRYAGSTIPILPKSEISSLLPSSVAVQPGLCRTWSETPKTGFSQRGSYDLCTWGRLIRILAVGFNVQSAYRLINYRLLVYDMRREKTCLRYFRPGPTQTGLNNHRRGFKFRI